MAVRWVEEEREEAMEAEGAAVEKTGVAVEEDRVAVVTEVREERWWRWRRRRR